MTELPLTLRVTEIAAEAKDVIVAELRDPTGRDLPAFGQKACQASSRRSDRIGPRQPDGVEAFGPAAVDDGVPELRAAQKSRSA